MDERTSLRKQRDVLETRLADARTVADRAARLAPSASRRAELDSEIERVKSEIDTLRTAFVEA